MTAIKHVLKVLAIIASASLSGYLLESYVTGTDLLNFYFVTLIGLLPIFLSFSIFGMTWFAYRRNRDNHSLFMGTAFLAIGLLDLFQMFSYPFLPDFSPEKSATLYGVTRLISAPLFLASAFIYKDTLPRLINKSIMFASALVLAAVVIVMVLFFSGNQPVMFNLDGSASAARILQLLITAAIILYASYMYAKRVGQTGQNYLILLIYSFIILIFSDILYFSYEISGRLLKIIGFYYVNAVLYRYSIELPYEKLAEAEEKLLHAAREKYRNLFDNANDAIITTDTKDRVTAWNRSAEKIFGWNAEEARGKKLSLLIVPPNLYVDREEVLRNVKSGEKLNGVMTARTRKDGARIDVSETLSPILDVNNEIAGLSAIIRDITETKKEEELRREKERFEYASKVKSEFLANMSHQIRTPLNALIGFSELMKQRISGELNETQQRYIDNILASGKFLLDLVNDLLDLSKVESGKIEMSIEKISVPAAINEALTLIKENATRHNVLLKTEFDPTLDFIEADRRRFKQILINLLGNAVKYSKPEGGIVTITAKKEGDMARFSVSDTGIGIKKEYLGGLFERFEYLEPELTRKYEGAGLGLALSKKLVELHGGKIMVESRFGEGSTFTFLLSLKEVR